VETHNGLLDLDVWCVDAEWLETPDTEFWTITLQEVHQMWPLGGIKDFDLFDANLLVACFSVLCSLVSCFLRLLSFVLNAHHRHNLKCSSFPSIYPRFRSDCHWNVTSIPL
jgi:hypothetical protein